MVSDNMVYYVSFNPLRQHQFASCYANGGVDIWDLRKTNAPTLTINAHI
jgi:hypothetical protein